MKKRPIELEKGLKTEFGIHIKELEKYIIDKKGSIESDDSDPQIVSSRSTTEFFIDYELIDTIVWPQEFIDEYDENKGGLWGAACQQGMPSSGGLPANKGCLAASFPFSQLFVTFFISL